MEGNGRQKTSAVCSKLRDETAVFLEIFFFVPGRPLPSAVDSASPAIFQSIDSIWEKEKKIETSPAESVAAV